MYPCTNIAWDKPNMYCSTYLYTLKGNNTAGLVMNTFRNVLIVKLLGNHLKADQTFSKVYLTTLGKNTISLSFRISVQPQADCVAFLEAVISDFSFLICDVGISEASISEVFLAMTSKGPPDTIVFASKLSSPPSPHPPSSSFPPSSLQ